MATSRTQSLAAFHAPESRCLAGELCGLVTDSHNAAPPVDDDFAVAVLTTAMNENESLRGSCDLPPMHCCLAGFAEKWSANCSPL